MPLAHSSNQAKPYFLQKYFLSNNGIFSREQVAMAADQDQKKIPFVLKFDHDLPQLKPPSLVGSSPVMEASLSPHTLQCMIIYQAAPQVLSLS